MQNHPVDPSKIIIILASSAKAWKYDFESSIELMAFMNSVGVEKFI
jgi:hypothetical protein